MIELRITNQSSPRHGQRVYVSDQQWEGSAFWLTVQASGETLTVARHAVEYVRKM